jgi:hypothetical protein
VQRVRRPIEPGPVRRAYPCPRATRPPVQATGLSGALALIDPRPPMVKDYSFVSLESITYRR